MKIYKVVYIFLSAIPFTWLLSFFVMLLMGTLHFDHLPVSGNQLNHASLGWNLVGFVQFCLLLIGGMATILWPLLVLSIWNRKR